MPSVRKKHSRPLSIIVNNLSYRCLGGKRCVCRGLKTKQTLCRSTFIIILYHLWLQRLKIPFPLALQRISNLQMLYGSFQDQGPNSSTVIAVTLLVTPVRATVNLTIYQHTLATKILNYLKDCRWPDICKSFENAGQIDGGGNGPNRRRRQRAQLMADSVMLSQSTSAAVVTGWTVGVGALGRLLMAVAATGNNVSMRRFITTNTIRGSTVVGGR